MGCGDGRFLRHAKEQGFEVWGIDFDKKSVENVKSNLGIDTVFAMSLEEFHEYANEKNLKFDVITFFEVLEHQDKAKGISGNGKRAFERRRIHSGKRAE